MDHGIDYGQDAPGLMRGFLMGGGVAGAVALGMFWLGAGLWGMIAAALCGVVALYLFGMGSFMVFESRIGKVRDRNALLASLPWRGDEVVLDVGCGRGLMLIGAARRLTTGRAVGIDLWRAQDQAGNSAEATLANAGAAGVADRVSVQTGDMVALPFAADRFDVVLSAWAVHNVPEVSQRHAALSEMLRVLKPGGILAVTDIEGRRDFQDALRALGAQDVRVEVLHPVKDRLVGALSFGTFAPFTVLGRKGRI